jgi:hypothetical protein
MASLSLSSFKLLKDKDAFVHISVGHIEYLSVEAPDEDRTGALQPPMECYTCAFKHSHKLPPFPAQTHKLPAPDDGFLF